MTALCRTGRQADALSAFATARAVLADELSIEPGAALRALHASILRQDPRLDGPSEEPSGEPGPLPAALRSGAPLAGRDGELAWLLAGWDARRADHLPLRLLAGPAGAGKTRLAAELARHVHAGGGEVVYAAGAGLGAALDRWTVGRARPTLLVADDLDAADPDALGRLAELVRSAKEKAGAQAGGQDLFVVGCWSATSTALGTWIARICAHRNLTWHLGGLDEGAVCAIVAAYLGEPDAGEVGRRLLPTTLGIPGRVHAAAAALARTEAERRIASGVRDVRRGRAVLASAETALASSLDDLRRLAGGPDGVPDGAPGLDPYKGLAAFDVADAPLFFGGERSVTRIVAALAAHRVVAVLGPSGSGKSSLLRAGLVPALQAGALPGSAGWRIDVQTPRGMADAWRPDADLVVVDQDVEAHLAFLHHVRELLEENGEYVDGQALTPARTWVRLRRPGRRTRHHGRLAARDERPGGGLVHGRRRVARTRDRGRGLHLLRARPGWRAAVRVD